MLDETGRPFGAYSLTELNGYRERKTWIPVTERLPRDEDGDTLVFMWNGRSVLIGYCDHGDWYIAGIPHAHVTHWRSIEYPQPPSE